MGFVFANFDANSKMHCRCSRFSSCVDRACEVRGHLQIKGLREDKPDEAPQLVIASGDVCIALLAIGSKKGEFEHPKTFPKYAGLVNNILGLHNADTVKSLLRSFRDCHTQSSRGDHCFEKFKEALESAGLSQQDYVPACRCFFLADHTPAMIWQWV